MTEPYIYPPTGPAHAGRVSIANGASTATFTGTALSGRDWTSAALWIFPAAAAPYFAGTVAALDDPDSYENLSLPLVYPWRGTAIVSEQFVLIGSVAQASGAAIAAQTAKFLASFQQGLGLVGDTRDEKDYTIAPSVTWEYKPDTHQIIQRRAGLEEPLELANVGVARGPWTGPPDRTAVAIVGGEVTIDYDTAMKVNDTAYVVVTVDDDCTVNPPVNAPLASAIDILWQVQGDGNVITWDDAWGVTENFVRMEDGDQTRTIAVVSALDESDIVTALSFQMVTWAQNDMLQYEDFNFVSNIDENGAEPVVDEEGSAVSDLNWTNIRTRGDQGEPGSAIVKALTTDTVNLTAGTQTIDLLGTVEHGLDIGALINVASSAAPITKRLEARVTGYTAPDDPTLATLTFEVDADGVVGTGSFSDGVITIAGNRGAPGVGPGLLMTWDTGTTDANPGMGKVRANNADLSAATFLYVNKSARTGSSIANDLAAIGAVSSVVKARVMVKRFSDGKSASFDATAETDASSYVKLAVSNHSGETGFTLSDEVSLEIALSGEGGMTTAVYDPTGVNDDAFDMDNMADGTSKVAMTAAERAKLTDIDLVIAQLALGQADALNAATFLGSTGNRFADSFDALTYVDTAGATNLDSGTAGQLKPSIGSSSAISGATGTNIGDMTGNGGLAACFDGTTNKPNSTSASKSAATLSYVGKNYSASPKKIAQAQTYGSNESGYVGTANPSVTIKLWGKNGSAPANASDGTELGTVTFTDTNNLTNDPRTITSSDTTTSYDYVWVSITGNGTNATLCAQVIFSTPGTTNNLTVASTGLTLTGTPTTAKIVALVEETDAITLNTDLKFHASRDGGSTFTQATMTDLFTRGSIHVLQSADIDLSAQGAASTMKWKITTANNKAVIVHAVFLYWT